ncbi:MAG: transcription termination/antitermination protein NusA [Nitrospirae bacterium RBG_19FT_COMBO_42_15]|nr:MAG: transcription termination/antitermination protein NusA [Nitrospirae bacterium RBG_19FT_COMBO_42_15]
MVKALESALLVAAKKKFGSVCENINVSIDPKTGEIQVIAVKKIVENVQNPREEISLEEATKMDEGAEIGDEIGNIIPMDDLGRIAAQTAKQVIIQKVREAEWDVILKDFKNKQGDLINGVVMRQERRDYIIDLGKTEGVLPAKEQIPGEPYRRGDRVRAYILDVRHTPKGPQIILSRTHPNLLAKLFEMEVPEVYEGIVSVKGVVREPGDRAKIAVASKDSSIDPVGACVGVKGSRVQAVVRELRGEKIDIIAWSDDPRAFIGEALSPAVIERVGINEQEKSATIVVADQQLSLAIGKKGQNVRLAAKLTGWKIDILSETEYQGKRAAEREKEITEAIAHETKQQEKAEGESAAEEAAEAAAEPSESDIASIPGVGEKTVLVLKEHGFSSIKKIAEATEDELSKIPKIGEKTAKKIIDAAREIIHSA